MAPVASVELIFEHPSLECLLRAECPLVSILIPGFNDLHGVRRILEKVPRNLVDNGTVEVLLSDDSPDFRIGRYFLDSDDFRFVIVLAGPGRGGAANWNFLLRKSNGRFIQFIHHDECPWSPDFFSNLVKFCGNGPRILFHSCVLRKKSGDFLHCRLSLIELTLKYVPSYFMRRNVFGSPSNFCVPRSEVDFFNEELVLYVDVDWYSRFSKDLAWLSTGLTMLSFDNSESITNHLRKNGLREVRNKEALLLRKVIPRFSLSVVVIDFFFFLHRACNILFPRRSRWNVLTSSRH